ncbi:MAG TPA: DUF5818 domain-containing protein [Candidatus Sulfotelmatobacter sp.]|nr:DUF5818 domain-containing protein [Candidatus Sulfotelmatobacter sp.]
MRRRLSILLALGLTGSGLTAGAQQTSSPATPLPGEADPIPQHRQTDAGNSLQSARSFHGRILRVGRQFVLRETSAHTSYSLDDQKKAGQYEGKRVKVMATMDPTSNTLHVIDIVDSTGSH